MGLFSRISDIISANFNDMVDGLEDPEKMLRQAVREMETTIEKAKESTAKTMAGRQLMKKELQKNRQNVELWAGRAQSALADKSDEMARKAIARKQEHEKLVIALQEEIAESDNTIQKLRHQLNAMQAKLAEAKRHLVTLTARKRVADLRTRVNEASESLGAEGNAFAKFDRMREKVVMAEAQADAMYELRSDNVIGEENPETTTLEVEAELAELKKKANA